MKNTQGMNGHLCGTSGNIPQFVPHYLSFVQSSAKNALRLIYFRHNKAKAETETETANSREER